MRHRGGSPFLVSILVFPRRNTIPRVFDWAFSFSPREDCQTHAWNPDMIMNCIPWPCSQQGKKKVARAICIVTPNLCQNDLRPRNGPSQKRVTHPVLSFAADEVWDTRHLGSPGKALHHTHTHISVYTGRPVQAQQRALQGR